MTLTPEEKEKIAKAAKRFVDENPPNHAEDAMKEGFEAGAEFGVGLRDLCEPFDAYYKKCEVEIGTLAARLKEAEEALRFYADRANTDRVENANLDYGNQTVPMLVTIGYDDTDNFGNSLCMGRRAREYFKKWEGKT